MSALTFKVLLVALTVLGTATGSTNLARRLNDVTDIDYAAPDVLMNIVSDLRLFIKRMIGFFLSMPMREDTFTLLRKTTGRLSHSLEVFGSRMLNATEVITKDIIVMLRQRLENFEHDLHDLSRLTDEKFDGVIIYVNNTVMEKSLSMNAWANNLKQQLRSMNDTSLYQRLCPIIDALIKETADELSGCCNIVIKPIKSICRSVRAILREAFHVLANVVEILENCIFSEEKFDSMVMACLDEIYDNVSELMDRAASLRHALLTKLPTRVLLSNFCVAIVTVSMASKQNTVEQEIEYLNN